jgi:nucleotide-binding universal stress UspA family protein
MPVYRNILVPIDGSSTAARGLTEATALAKDQGATIRLIHVINELVLMTSFEAAAYSGEFLKTLRDSGQQILDRAQQQVATAGVTVESVLVEALGGQAGRAISNDAAQWPADLIVLGTHGRRGLSRVLMGSDAEQVVRLVRVPVLLIRHIER